MIACYDAQFPDGFHASKRAQTLVYSHAWRIRFENRVGRVDDLVGFSTSQALAEGSLHQHAKQFQPRRHTNGARILIQEVVPVQPR